MAQMKKVPYGVKAKEITATKSEMDEIAIYSGKGIPMQSATKTWIVTVDDNGNLTATEVTK